MKMHRATYGKVFCLACWVLPILGIKLVIAVTPAQSADALPQPVTNEELIERRQILEQQIERLNTQLREIQKELENLKSLPAPSTDVQMQTTDLEEREVTVLEEISVVSSRLLPQPTGVSRSTTPRYQMDNQPARDFRESLESEPGIILQKTNGPRDFNISIRGLGAKQSFGIAKIRLFEDGFDLTQSDGLSRLDLPDPWFMRSIIVERGASSAMYGNFALGGMVNFLTRRGSDIRGVETFSTVGSYGYQKYATAIGQEYQFMDAAVFVSHERGDGYTHWSTFDTTTVDANFRFNIGETQTLTFKAANNDINTLTPQRLTLQQFQANPKQAGTGAKENDRSRRDHRTIVGARYTNQFTPTTGLFVSSVYDVKDINQKFGVTLDQVQPNWKNQVDIRNISEIFGQPLRSLFGGFFNYLETESTTFRNLADFAGSKRNAINNQRGSIRHLGFRLREEFDFAPRWTLAAGMGYERSEISIQQTNYNFFTGSFMNQINANRVFHNAAPDVSLTFYPDESSRYWTRVSGGYGIPGFGDLTTTPDGLPGANNDLESEQNLNLEVGGQARLHPSFSFQLVGFWNFFKNELISQTVLGGTGIFTTNADSSEYRGVEVKGEWVPAQGVLITGAYTYVNAKFINYTDTILVGGVGTPVNRDGNIVPAVPPHVLNVRAAYDHASGWGGWAEVTWLDDYFVNNANTLKAQSATIANLNVHYSSLVDWGWVRLFQAYVQVENVFDQTYMTSSAIVSDSTPDAFKQAFLLGQPLSVFGGITLGLF